MSDFNPCLSLRASSLFGEYREKWTRERHARGDAKRVLARLASLAQMQATPDLESDFVDTVYVTIYFSCHNNFLLSSELGALLRTTF